MEDYMAFSLEPLVGRTPAEVEHLVGPWVEDFIEPIIFSDATKAIAAHRKAGDRILVISASGTHLVGADRRAPGHRRDSRRSKLEVARMALTRATPSAP
jgi:phosphoserine phosphatase